MSTLIPKFKQPYTNAVNRAINLKLQETLSIEDFGGIGDGSTDNTTAYTNAVSAITTSGKKYNLFFPVGTYKFNSGITLDITLMSITCENCVFDFSGIATSATAITVTGTVGDIYSNIKTCLSGVVIEGPGTGGTSQGIYFNAATSVGAAHIELYNVGVTNFHYGVIYGANAYIITFDHCSIYGNERGFQSYVGVGVNAGERISFVNSSIFNNSAYGLRVEDTNASIHVINTSLDYNVQALYLSTGFVHFTGCYFEFSDQISSSDPRFLYADGLGTNTSAVSYSDCTFKIGTVASATSTPVFDVTSTTSVAHTNCTFYLNTNRSIIFKLRTGSTYTETNANVQYAGTSFRVLDTGCSYSISSSGANSVGFATTSANYAINSVTPITDIFTSAFATGNIATSTAVLANGIYTLYTATQLSANSGTYGQYLIQRIGTQTTIATIKADASVTVTIDGAYKVVVTNSSGADRTLDCILQRNTGQSI
jgi:hypothetical protein